MTEFYTDVLTLKNSRGRIVFQARLHPDRSYSYHADGSDGYNHFYPGGLMLPAACAWSDNTSCTPEGILAPDLIEFCRLTPWAAHLVKDIKLEVN